MPGVAGNRDRRPGHAQTRFPGRPPPSRPQSLGPGRPGRRRVPTGRHLAPQPLLDSPALPGPNFLGQRPRRPGAARPRYRRPGTLPAGQPSRADLEIPGPGSDPRLVPGALGRAMVRAVSGRLAPQPGAGPETALGPEI